MGLFRRSLSVLDVRTYQFSSVSLLYGKWVSWIWYIGLFHGSLPWVSLSVHIMVHGSHLNGL